jgi:tRNA(adenine34) deaminase
MVQARIARLVYGADDPKCGAIRSVLRLAETPQLNHHFAVTSGVMADECGEVVRQFFQRKRQAGSSPDE